MTAVVRHFFFREVKPNYNNNTFGQLLLQLNNYIAFIASESSMSLLIQSMLWIVKVINRLLEMNFTTSNQLIY